MNETNHTPGPWNLEYRGGDLQVISGRTFGKIREVAKIIGFDGLATGDAKLIAAAPDLLDACRHVVQWHREHDSGEGELFGLNFATACIAAIDKATHKNRGAK